MTDLKKLEWMKRGRLAGWITFTGLGVAQAACNTLVVNIVTRGSFQWVIGIIAGMIFWNLMTVGDKIKKVRKAIETKL